MGTQTGSLDLKLAKEAAKSATNYLSDITAGGLFVHPEGTPSDPTNVNAEGVLIDDGVDIIRQGVSVAEYGSTTRIGESDAQHISITNNSFGIQDVAGGVPIYMASDDTIHTSTSTNVYTMYANYDGRYAGHKIILKGYMTDDYKCYVGVALPGSTFDMSNYLVLDDETEKTTTIDNVYISLQKIANNIIAVKVKNNNSSARQCCIQIPYKYVKTTAIINQRSMAVEGHGLCLQDITGTCSYAYVYTYGNMANLVLHVYNGSQVANGSYIYRGSLSSYVPCIDTGLIGYTSPSGSSLCAVTGTILSNGSISVINTSGKAVTTNSSNYSVLHATYIMKEGS